jgi:hypothetical protein
MKACGGVKQSSTHILNHDARWRCDQLRFYIYKVQILQALTFYDYDICRDFTIEMLDCTDNDNAYINRGEYLDEATFQLSGYVNKQNAFGGSRNLT